MHFNPCAPYGARRIDVAGPILGTEISIHAPLTGRDVSVPFGGQPREPISIHAPLTGRDASEGRPCVSAAHISIHAPLTGHDLQIQLVQLLDYISIHAPLTGRDLNTRSNRAVIGYFNPRAPYGARPQAVEAHPDLDYTFQSTRPLRGATTHRKPRPERHLHFNPRAPYGARLEFRRLQKPQQEFQSTRPLRGATLIFRTLIL